MAQCCNVTYLRLDRNRIHFTFHYFIIHFLLGTTANYWQLFINWAEIYRECFCCWCNPFLIDCCICLYECIVFIDDCFFFLWRNSTETDTKLKKECKMNSKCRKKIIFQFLLSPMDGLCEKWDLICSKQ